VITAVLLSVLGVLLVIVLVLMMRSPSRRKQIGKPVGGAPLPPAAGGDLFAARKGDVVSIHGAAEDFSDIDFTVDRRSAYQSGGRRWIDLSGEYRGGRVYVEVHPGPEPEITAIIDPRRLTLADIRTSEEQLAEMDRKQSPWLYVEFEGNKWQYESSRELGYLADEQQPGEGLYRWIFKEQNGPRMLCVEKWEGEPFDVRVARRLNLADINVYRAA
jgi:hypothetical protein